MKLFLKEFDTPMPQSEGVAFLDKYIDSNWKEKPKSKDNNCYVLLPSCLDIHSHLLEGENMTLGEWRNLVGLFLKGIYFQGGSQLSAKLSFL